MMGGGDAVIGRADIMDRLKVILEPWLEDDECGDLADETSLLTDLGLDSVAIMQLILGIEKELAVRIEDWEFDSALFSRAGNLVDLIEAKLNEAV